MPPNAAGQPKASVRHKPPPKVRRIVPGYSSSITLAVVFTLLLAISIATLMYFMELASTMHQRNNITSIVATDMQGLLDAHRVGGIEGLVDILQYRLKHPELGQIYALANSQDTVLVGNFAYIPEAWPTGAEMREMALDPKQLLASELPDDREYVIIATHRALEEGYHLMVGRNVPDMEVKQQFIGRLGWGVIILLIILCAAGFFIGDRVVYRINLIADTASYIINTGDLSKRIPVPGRWDDLSKLATMLNALLARMETLVHGIRQVSDNIAHDLRTPLTRLQNQLEALHERGVREALPIQDCTERLSDEITEILNTFAALLRIRNLEAGKWNVEAEMVAVDLLINDLMELYEPLAHDKEQVIDVTTDPLSIKIDKHLLFQAIANCVDNAIKYAPKAGHIRVHLTAGEGDEPIMITIYNSGSHVEPDALAQIFKHFFRTDQARSSRSGNGLGLSLVKAIILHYRGSIRAYNTEDGFAIEMCLPATMRQQDDVAESA